MNLKFDKEIDWFATVMKAKMSQPQNLGKSHWRTMSQAELLQRIRDEVEELSEAIAVGGNKEIISELADIGDFCMMMADNCRPDVETCELCGGRLGSCSFCSTEQIEST